MVSEFKDDGEFYLQGPASAGQSPRCDDKAQAIYWKEWVNLVLEAGVAAERERCARIAEETSSIHQDGRPKFTVGYDIALSIRGGGK